MHLKRLKDLREDADLTQEDIAKILNISQRLYSYYETGQRQMPYIYLLKLADFYHTTTDYLLGRTDIK